MKRPKRRYVMRARGERMEETRARIVDATMRLHEEIGPRGTTISAIAQEAGVERLTVYRHFPDEGAVFAACSHRFTELNPPPDFGIWDDEPDPRKRVQRALSELYAYFSRAARMLHKVYRDAEDFPALKSIMDGFEAYLRDAADSLAKPFGPRSKTVRLKAILRHAVKFQTWQSFEAEDISNPRKITLILEWIDPTETK